MNEKENLVLVHSFPTNSILLSGLIDYLSDYFKVYFIDLPGFTKAVPPLERVTFQGFYDFAQQKIREFNLPHYLVGGISFGFAIVNNIRYDSRCKGVLAIEPFITSNSLRYSPFKKSIYGGFIGLVCSLRLYKLFWDTKFAKDVLQKIKDYPSGTMGIMSEQIDGKTFFETARMLLKDKTVYRFHKLPYALIANKDDRTVNYDYLYDQLSKNVEKLLVINTVIDHYPRDTSKAYFKRMVTEDVFEKISGFFAANQPEVIEA